MGRMRKKHSRGFSLVELLISMVLLSTIVLLSSFSYAQFSKYWDGRLGNFDRAFSKLRNGWLLDDILGQVHPYVVRNSQGVPRFYFEGNINGFVAVSKGSVSRVDTNSVIRLALVQNSDGSYKLLFEEAPMSSRALVELTQQPSFAPPIVLIESLQNPEFSYFGTEPPRPNMTGIDIPLQDIWAVEYNSAETRRHPKKIRLRWFSEGEAMTCEVDLMQPARGQLATMMPDGFDI